MTQAAVLTFLEADMTHSPLETAINHGCIANAIVTVESLLIKKCK